MPAVTEINVKTSAGDSSQIETDWPQFSIPTATTVRDFLPAHGNTADDKEDDFSSKNVQLQRLMREI